MAFKRMMEKQSTYSNPIFNFLPLNIDGFNALATLALDMRWSWNHAADELWQQLDPSLWELTHNPWMVLQTLSENKLKECLTDTAFRKKLEALLEAREHLFTQPAWFQINYPYSPLTAVAYFSMEFMLSEALPIYVGGLGNVAGDLLKAASDLGVPVVAVGLLYQQGYFRQEIDKNGAQQVFFPYNDPGQLPLTPLRKPNGEWLRVEVEFPGNTVWLRTWHVQVGRVSLYLLDSNDGADRPSHRGITSELYGGRSEMRIMQEIVLGIGGWRLLMALGLHPEVCHLNEGHSAFVALERASHFMAATGQPFDVALTVTRAGNLFTTHTAMAAGFDAFSPELVEQYLGHYAQEKLGITFHQLLALGRSNPAHDDEKFSMAYLAMRTCNSVNAVSRLHGQVSRSLFEPLYTRWPQAEVPVGYVTNGVHMPTWDSQPADALWTEAGGKERWRGALETLESDIYLVPDEKLWQMRNASRKTLIEFTRKRWERQLANAGEPQHMMEQAKLFFDPHVLTIGFARRFVGYKRPLLLLYNPERLIRILTNPDRPVQLIIAGKAPPYDEEGLSSIRQWNQFVRRPEVMQHAVFLSDYDMLLTEQLVQGVDVWINTPRRPGEACGTSGMKILVNGGLNLSELDGWWEEAYNPEVGWALGDQASHNGDPSLDAAEAERLYDLLEQEVIPEFYTRNSQDIPSAWIDRMRKSMSQLTGRFSSNRMVRAYTEQYYIPAAKAYDDRAFNKEGAGVQMVAWKNQVAEKWSSIRFTAVDVTTNNGQHTFEVKVFLNGLPAHDVLVELYAEGLNNQKPFRQSLVCIQQPANGYESHVYEGKVAADRAASDYTARIIPHYPGIPVPGEINLVLWQH